MNRLLTEVGLPVLLAAVYVAGLATPAVWRWIRFEIELGRRVSRYEEREEAARIARVRW